MDPNDIKKLRKLTSFEALVDYLRVVAADRVGKSAEARIEVTGK